MKTLLFYVLMMMVCMHTIHASNSDTCQRELSNLLTEVTEYLTNFETEHDLSREYVKALKVNCDALMDALKVYGANDYGTGQKSEQLKGGVSIFVAAFFPKFGDAMDLFTRIEIVIDSLVEMTACLVDKNNLACDANCNLGGCAVNLNKARCIIVNFTNAVPGAAKRAYAILSGLRNGAKQLNQLTRKLSAKYYLTCKSNGCTCDSGRNDLTLQITRNFFKRFQSIHDPMYVLFEELRGICNIIVDAINATQDAFSSL